MTARAWVGGSDGNDIYADDNWSPAGTPQPGDTLSLDSGIASMAGGNLAGNTLEVGTQTPYSSPPPAVVNLSWGASLTAVAQTTSFTDQQIVFNACGFDTLDLTVNGNPYATMGVTENIAPFSLLRGTFALSGHNGSVDMEGSGFSFFDNDGASSVGGDGGAALINADVVGVGSFSVGGFAGLTFLRSVWFGQTVSATGGGQITIGEPDAFFGLVDLPDTGAPFRVALTGITTADSYSYHDDLLTLFQGSQPIDTLRLAANGSSFQVTEDASGVLIEQGGTQPAPGAALLPQETQPGLAIAGIPII